MKMRRILALCAVLLVASFATAACAGAPAPSSAPPAPAAAAPAMPATEMAGESVALRARVLADQAWEMDDFAWEGEAALNFTYGSSQADVSVTGGSTHEQPTAQQRQRMIVTTFNLTAETMDFESSVAFIRSLTDEFGGYIESSSEEGLSIRFDHPQARNAFFAARVPSGRVHEFVGVVGENTNVVSTNEHTTDITNSFFDNQARLDSLVNQERLLNELLDSEDAGLHYILEVHRELANVRHQIEFMNTIIQQQEQSVNFSTVHVQLNEVMQYRPVEGLPMTFGERINQATYNSWNSFVRQAQNMVVNAIWRAPLFLLDLLILAFWVGLFLLVRMFIRKRKGRQRGEDTFDWLPVSRLKRNRIAREAESNNN